MNTTQKGKIRDAGYMLRFLRPYLGKVIGGILSGIFKEVCVISAVGICAYMAAIIAGGNRIENRNWMWILVIVVFGRAVFAYLESFLNHDVAYHILVDFRVKLYQSFIGLCPDILFKTKSGQISTTLMNDVEVLEWFFAHTVGIFIVDTVLLGAITIFMGSLHWMLAVLLLIAVAVIVFIPFIMQKRADAQGKESRFRLGETNSVILEGINGMNEIVTLNHKESYKRKSRSFMDALTEIQVAYSRRMGTEGGLLQTASGVAAVLINLCGVYLVLHGMLSIRWYAVVGTTVWLIFGPLLELCNMARNFGVIFAASGRIRSILEGEAIVKDTGANIDITNIRPNISFENVCYRYAGTQQDVLKKVSFQAKRGQVTALVGESGAGKTTCANLLIRMWDIQSGNIRIGGRDIREMSLENLHKLVSTVPQDVYLFNISMRDNITLGKPDATQEEVVRVAKMARIHEFIESLPQGYDTVCGERGVMMSGGQRQRVAIARALLADTPILVMDEAVSNLDTQTDKEIQETIRSIAKEKTVLLVAHRLSTILDADQLIVLKNGEVVQTGTHESLIKEEGYYHELMRAQLAEEERVTHI